MFGCERNSLNVVYKSDALMDFTCNLILYSLAFQS
jgi:hypothetical protein